MNLNDSLELGLYQGRAEAILRALEKRYFSALEPVSAVGLVADLDGPSRYLPTTKEIQLDAGVARFTKLVQFLILHELVHHKLATLDPNYSNNPYGEPFQRETQKLFQLGAYDKLL